jgi:hypothetical protein
MMLYKKKAILKFDSISHQSQFFSVSGSRISIVPKSFGGWKGMRATKPLPKLQKSVTEVRIDQIQPDGKNQSILIEICPNSNNEESHFNRIGSFASCANGAISVNGGAPHQIFNGIDGYKAGYHQLKNSLEE